MGWLGLGPQAETKKDKRMAPAAPHSQGFAKNKIPDGKVYEELVRMGTECLCYEDLSLQEENEVVSSEQNEVR